VGASIEILQSMEVLQALPSMEVAQAAGNSSILTYALALVLGAAPVLYILWAQFSRKEKPKPEPFPEDGVFTLKSLAKFDGVVNPICLGVCGKVVDVSTSGNIQAGEGYGKLWAGRDATWSLAMLSLKAEDANTMEYKLSDFTPEQHKALAGWYKHFTTKYTVVGKLQEYEGWDFSSVQEEAKSQTPFGAPKTEGAAEATGDVASPSKAPKTTAFSAAAKPAEVGMVLAKGDRVIVKDLDDARKELEGAVGILQGFDRKEGGFEVALEGTGRVEVFKPAQLAKA